MTDNETRIYHMKQLNKKISEILSWWHSHGSLSRDKATIKKRLKRVHKLLGKDINDI